MSAQYPCFFHGVDREGHPLYFELMGRANPGEVRTGPCSGSVSDRRAEECRLSIAVLLRQLSHGLTSSWRGGGCISATTAVIRLLAMCSLLMAALVMLLLVAMLAVMLLLVALLESVDSTAVAAVDAHAPRAHADARASAVLVTWVSSPVSKISRNTMQCSPHSQNSTLFDESPLISLLLRVH